MKITFLSIFFFLSMTTFAQKDLDQFLDQYIKNSESLNVDATLDAIYPRFYEIVDRDLMKNAMQSLFTNTIISVSFSDSRIKSLSKIKRADSLKYVFTEYAFNMKMRINNKDISEATFNMMTGLYKLKYGENNVKFDLNSKSYDIAVVKKMIVLYSPSMKWKVLGMESSQVELVKSILPKKIYKDMKKMMTKS